MMIKYNCELIVHKIKDDYLVVLLLYSSQQSLQKTHPWIRKTRSGYRNPFNHHSRPLAKKILCQNELNKNTLI